MKIFKTKLSDKGFSQVESVLLVVVLVVLSVTGYYVWNHNKALNTAHAGGYAYEFIYNFDPAPKVSSTKILKFYGCRQVISSSLWVLQVKVVATGFTADTSTYAQVTDYRSKTSAPIWYVRGNTWVNNKQFFSHHINPSVNNLLDFGDVVTSGEYIRPSILPKC